MRYVVKLRRFNSFILCLVDGKVQVQIFPSYADAEGTASIFGTDWAVLEVGHA